MTVKAGHATSLLSVADLERSLRFYTLLGFQLIDVELEGDVMTWARLHCEGGALMFIRSEEGEPPGHGRCPLYMYTPDLPALCAQLAEAGVEVGSIRRPGYMPSGEICLADPDGNTILIGHWGEREHQAWLDLLEKKRAAGLLPKA